MKKKLFSKNKLTKENLIKFFDKEGFYVVVFLCLAIIATTAVYITRDNMTPISQGNEENQVAEHEYYQPEDLEPEPEDDGEEASAIVEEEEENEDPNQSQGESTEGESADQEKAIITDEDIPNATPVISPVVEEEREEPKSDSSTAQAILNNLSNPVDNNTITMDYSFQTAPVFSATLDAFRSDHKGIDISAEKGTIVKAAMDGKVIDIVEDARLGMTITIDHGSGVKTKYANLDTSVNVTKNQSVKKGDEIGKAGNTALFEIDDDPHIHFEVWHNEESVDPKKYIKELGNRE